MGNWTPLWTMRSNARKSATLCTASPLVSTKPRCPVQGPIPHIFYHVCASTFHHYDWSMYVYGPRFCNSYSECTILPYKNNSDCEQRSLRYQLRITNFLAIGAWRYLFIGMNIRLQRFLAIMQTDMKKIRGIAPSTN